MANGGGSTTEPLARARYWLERYRLASTLEAALVAQTLQLTMDSPDRRGADLSSPPNDNHAVR